MNTQDDKGYIQFNRSREFFDMIAARPTAFVLLSLIAQRARRTTGKILDGLEVGQARIGDHDSYGVSRQVYRLDKRYLNRVQMATFKGTKKGTIATLLSNAIFDINAETKEPSNEPSKEPSVNHQRTTNNNDKNERIIKNIYTSNFSKKYSPLKEDELALAGKVAEWLARPIHNLNFADDYQKALGYSKKIVTRLGKDKVSDLYEEYAEGAFPNAWNFLSAVKETMSGE